MKCSHCLVEFHPEWSRADLGRDIDGTWKIRSTICPACQRFTISADRLESISGKLVARLWLYPKGVSRPQPPDDVPEKFRIDYKEASLVLSDSPKASAALSRRCLQHLLREAAKVKPDNLNNEIQEVLESKAFPSHLADALDAVRVLGNFAAHPIKSTNTGEIVEVEDGEAEWSLDTLDGLFDFWFTQPAALKKKRDALNEKLQEVGKPPLKQSDNET